MGQIILQDKTGLNHGFTISGASPTPTEQSRIDSILNPQPAAAPPQAPQGDPRGIASLAGDALSNFYYQSKAGVQDLAGTAADDMGFTDYGKDMHDDAAANNATADQYQAPAGSPLDQPGLWNKTKAFGYGIAQSSPIILGAVAGAKVGAGIGAILSPEAAGAGAAPGGFIGGVIGGGLAAWPSMTESNLDAQRESKPGVTPNYNKAAAVGAAEGTFMGTADALTGAAGGVIAKPFMKPAAGLMEEATQGAIATYAKKMGQGAAVGLTSNAIQGAANDALTRWQADQPLGDADAQKSYIQNAIVGGLLGVGMGAGMGAVGAHGEISAAAKKAAIDADLKAADTPEQSEKNMADFEDALHKRASADVDAQDALRQGAQPIDQVPQITGDLYHPLDDGHPTDPLLSGPNTVMREPSAGTTSAENTPPSGAPEAGPEPSTPQSPASPAAPKQIFKEQEYADAVNKMAQERMISADKIKNAMKIGRAKAQAIFDAMRSRTDGRPAGTDGQYLSPVQRSTSGDTAREAEAGAPKPDAGAKENSETVTRSYEVRPIAKDDASPYKIIVQGGRRLDTTFKTAEEAHKFAEDSGLSANNDYAVEHVPESGQHGVYEVTSGVRGNQPTSRLSRAFDTSEEAHAYAKSQNPDLSTEANEALADEKAKDVPGTDQNRLARIQKRKGEILSQIQDHLQTLTDNIAGPGKAKVSLEDQIRRWVMDKNGVIHGLHDREIIEGETDPGVLGNGMIRMALNAGMHDISKSMPEYLKSISGIAHHEVIHVLRAANVIKPAEWHALVRRSKQNVSGKKYTYFERAQHRTGRHYADPHLNEEAVAEMFRDHMRDPLTFSNDTRGTMKKMADFVKSFGQYTKHLQEGNRILSDIGEGKMAGREKLPLSEAVGPWHSSVKLDGFFNKSGKIVDEMAQNQPDKALSADEWMNFLKGKQISPDELKWLGLNDALKGSHKIQARDVAQLIRANSVEVKLNKRTVGETGQDAARWDHHRQPGGENYTELVFHIPHLDGPKFKELIHYPDVTNVLATARGVTRNVRGMKLFDITEIQSDLHQRGSQQGYASNTDIENLTRLRAEGQAMAHEANLLQMQAQAASHWEDSNPISPDDTDYLGNYHDGWTPETRAQHDEIQARYDANMEARRALDKAGQIPDAPLKKKWPDFVVKAVVKHAIETGHDGITWPGEPEAVRQNQKWDSLHQEGGDKPTYHLINEANVTPIVNRYLKDIPAILNKTYGTPDFGHATTETLERTKAADMKMEDAFPTKGDFDMAMQGLIAHNHNDDWMQERLHQARQVAVGQRQFDPEAALRRAGVPVGRMMEELGEVFPGFSDGSGDFDGTTTDAEGNPNVDRGMMKFTPEMKSVVTGQGQPFFSAVKRETPAPDTPEFRKWFGGSKIVDSEGKPLVLYHGTTKDFEKFERSQYTGADMGAGFYFSDNAKEASHNYAGLGPDMHYKLDQATQELIDNDHDVDLDESGHDKNLRASFFDHEGAMIPAYLSMKNPVYLGGPNDTIFQQTDVNHFVKSVNAIKGDFLNVDMTKLARDLQGTGPMHAHELRRAFMTSGGVMDAIDPWSGMLSAPELMRLAFKDMGYDGIVDTQVGKKFAAMEGMTPDTTHYIAFEPNQIKSVNNTGSYNPEDNRIMYSGVKPSYSATGTFGGRVPTQPPRNTRADFEGRMFYNVIAPTFEKFLNIVGKLPGAKKAGMSPGKSQDFAENQVIKFQDRMQPLAKLIDGVRKAGGMITSDTDGYQAEQLMHGTIGSDLETADKGFYKPLINGAMKVPVTEAHIQELLNMFPSQVVNVNGTPVEKEVVQSILNQHKGQPKKAIAELYLYAQHAQERNAVMRERNKNVIGLRPDQYQAGSGMTDATSQRILDWVSHNRDQNIPRTLSDLTNPDSVRSRMRALIKHTNDTRVAGGLNPDFRTMIDPTTNLPYDTYQDYVPMRGWTDDNTDRINDNTDEVMARIGKRFKITGKEDKNALGRQSVASNLIANAALQNEEAIIRANKNKVAQAVLGMSRDNTNLTMAGLPGQVPHHMADFIEEVPLSERKPTYDKASGTVKMTSHNVTNDPDIFVAKLGGKEVGMRIKDPKLRAALMGDSMLGQTGQNALIKGLLGLNRFLAATRTSLNPEFLMGNFFRDTGHAFVNMSEFEIKGFKRKVIGDVRKAIFGVHRGLVDGKPTPWSQAFEDFKAHGAKTEFMGQRDLGSRIERLADDMREDPKGNAEKIMGKIKHLGEFVDHWNDSIENGIRLSTYKHMVDHFQATSADPARTLEGDKSKAAMIAKNLTTNFNMGGTLKPTLNAYYLFYNAGMQGSASMLAPMIRNKAVRRMWLGAVAGGVVQDAMMSMLSPIGPDGQSEYDKIPDQVLQTNMVLLNPLGGYIKIPMPYLFNAAWNAGRAGMRGVRGGYTPGQTLNNVFGTMADAVNPFGGGGSFLNFVAPTVADPLVDLFTNTNYMGAPIAPPKDPYSSNDIPSQRYWNNTSPAEIKLAGIVDKLTGGDGVFKGGLSFSPNQYDYVFQYLGGGALSTIMRAFNFVAPQALLGQGNLYKIADGEGHDVSLNDIPFARRLLGNLSARDDLSAYIANRDKVLTVLDKMREAKKSGDTAEYQRIITDYPDAYKQAAKVNGMENERRKISSEIKTVNANQRISDEKRAQLVDALKRKQTDLVNKANSFMNGK